MNFRSRPCLLPPAPAVPSGRGVCCCRVSLSGLHLLCVSVMCVCVYTPVRCVTLSHTHRDTHTNTHTHGQGHAKALLHCADTGMQQLAYARCVCVRAREREKETGREREESCDGVYVHGVCGVRVCGVRFVCGAAGVRSGPGGRCLESQAPCVSPPPLRPSAMSLRCDVACFCNSGVAYFCNSGVACCCNSGVACF